jgi:hypothetical protein
MSATTVMADDCFKPHIRSSKISNIMDRPLYTHWTHSNTGIMRVLHTVLHRLLLYILCIYIYIYIRYRSTYSTEVKNERSRDIRYYYYVIIINRGGE